MKIFIDSADIEEIKKAYSWGIIDGITTNPSLIKIAAEKIKKDNKPIDLKNYITDLLKVAKGTPVSLEVTETTGEGMLTQGILLYRLFNSVAKNVCIKIPINTSTNTTTSNFEGLYAINELAKRKIPVNCTLVFTPEQALLAAKAGATYVSPFAGRIDDHIRTNAEIIYTKEEYYPAEGKEEKDQIYEDNGIVSGVDLVAQCVEIIKTHNLATKVIAASIRNPRQVREMALVGAHIVTVPFEVLEKIPVHEKTREGMKKFTEDSIQEYKELVNKK